jgi:hypothetical protein
MRLKTKTPLRASRALTMGSAILLVTAALLWLGTSLSNLRAASSEQHNGFELSNLLIPKKEIRSGGPGRDGIPAIDEPRFIPPNQALFLKENDLVVSVTIGQTTRAYPLRILVWHEIVNDQIGDHAFMVTYCPLCGTAMVFNRTINGLKLSYGVSGLLYQSDVLMYDRETESLWSQLGMRAVSGSLSSTTLELLPSEIIAWGPWKDRNPKGMVLSTDTGFRRAYTENAYLEYAQSPDTAFPVPSFRLELPKKSWVVGVLVGREAKAYPLDKLSQRGAVLDRVGNLEIELSFDTQSQHVSVKARNSGGIIPYVKSYWFAWQAFYPETALWKP